MLYCSLKGLVHAAAVRFHASTHEQIMPVHTSKSYDLGTDLLICCFSSQHFLNKLANIRKCMDQTKRAELVWLCVLVCVSKNKTPAYVASN